MSIAFFTHAFNVIKMAVILTSAEVQKAATGFGIHVGRINGVADSAVTALAKQVPVPRSTICCHHLISHLKIKI
jgi:hypothetical protein